MNSTILFWIVITIIVVDYALERILDALNGKMRGSKIPEEVSDIYNEDDYQKQQNYELAKSKISFWISSVSFALIMVLFFVDGFALLDQWITTLNFGSIISGLLFFGILFLLSDILETPFEWYNIFVIEEKFGFNKMTPKIFIMDKIKSLCLSAVVGGGLLAGLMWLISVFGESFWVIAWVAVSVFLIFVYMFYSTLIVPLFNKQTPLEDGELKDAIFSFSQKAGFELDNIYVIDGSKRSTKANAYFSGLGVKKRIVLYDTLIQELTVPEIVAVLAHEIGHYKKKHTIMMLCSSVLQMGVILYLFGLFLAEPAFTQVLGIDYSPEKSYASFYVFSILFTPISFFIGLALNAFSRKNEYQADRFSGENYSPEELESALKKLTKSSLSNLTPHSWYVFCYYSHPTLYQRIKALRNIKNE
ncbi:MAG: M48 family metallopeptidase [Bacteroidales bacterium]|nr:M48 family metallopeptidase [Bacteroidales bacterium]